MSTVIKIENLSKKYVIGHQRQEKYTALRDVMAHKFRGIGQRLRHPLSPNKEETNLEDFWALKDINLEIKQGDRVGIIGRNGAGKSTLLKILSRITEPTTGRITINGRVASLLEVGTGFHPELTGRENIFLNGAILGMSRVDIKNNFDEIVAFSEIEKFLDTPVKKYSSGMYVRLAFAVAAHLEPEILIVDEVLAVGDAAFQKKCLGKMGEVSKEGRTVIFVSHNMSAVSELCANAAWIDKGQIFLIDKAEKTVQSYLSSNISSSTGFINLAVPKNKEAYISSIELLDEEGDVTNSFFVSNPIKAKVSFYCRRKFYNWRIYLDLKRYDGVTIFSTTSSDYNKKIVPIDIGTYSATVSIPARFLLEGNYLLSLAFGEPPKKRHDFHENVISFEVCGSAFDYGRSIGFLAYPFEWSIDRASTS